MYARTLIYRIYSVIMLVGGALSFIFSLAYAFSSFNLFNVLGMYSVIQPFIVLLKIIMIISSFVSLFFCYMEFSSMYVFTDMIQYEKSDSIYPMIKKSFIFSPKVYSIFGLVIFSINIICAVISGLVIVISQSIATSSFISLPVIPLAIIIAASVICYVNYYVRYKSISVLMEVTTSKELTEPVRQNLSELNPKWLRGYCVFLFAMCVVLSIVFVIILFIVFGSISAQFGFAVALGITIASILPFAVYIISIGILGCYFDNVAKMVEHYQIKYDLISNK